MQNCESLNTHYYLELIVDKVKQHLVALFLNADVSVVATKELALRFVTTVSQESKLAVNEMNVLKLVELACLRADNLYGKYLIG